VAAGVSLAPNNNFNGDKSIEEKVKDIIVEQLGSIPNRSRAGINLSKTWGRIRSISWSWSCVRRGIFREVPDEDAEKLQTVGDVIKYIEERAKGQQQISRSCGSSAASGCEAPPAAQTRSGEPNVFRATALLCRRSLRSFLGLSLSPRFSAPDF